MISGKCNECSTKLKWGGECDLSLSYRILTSSILLLMI